MKLKIVYNKFLIFNFLFLFIIGSGLGFGLIDYDHLLQRSNMNLYDNIVKFLNPHPIVLILFNILTISILLSKIFERNKLVYIFLITNPFILLNTFDAYNKFCFTIFMLYLSIRFFEKNINYFYIFVGFLFSIHPYYIFGLLYNKYVIKKLIIFLPISLVFLIFVFFYYDLSSLIYENDKYKLFMQYSYDIASLSEGNLALSKEITDLSFSSIIQRSIAMVIPILYIKSSSIGYLFLSLYLLAFFIYSMKIFLKNRLILISFISMFIFIVLFSGNVAVFYRHILPMWFFFLFYITINFTNLQKGER